MKVDEVDIKKLVIVRDGQAIWIGQPKGTAFPMPKSEEDPGPPFMVLSPAWQDIGGFQGNGGQVGRVRVYCMPDWLPSSEEVWVQPVSVVSLENISKKDEEELRGALKQAESIRGQVSAKQSGIEIAGRMPNLPTGRA